MTDLLLDAARRFGVPTDVSAGPGNGLPGLSIWARWPRHPQEVAQDLLNHLTQADHAASVSPLGGTPLWRASSRSRSVITLLRVRARTSGRRHICHPPRPRPRAQCTRGRRRKDRTCSALGCTTPNGVGDDGTTAVQAAAK